MDPFTFYTVVVVCFTTYKVYEKHAEEKTKREATKK